VPSENEPVETVAIAPDGRTAVTGSRDRTINAWDLNGTPAGA
jgi:WD40 repeat protein